MKLSQALAPLAGLVAAVNAWGETGVYWTTVVTTAYTTFCPSPTTFIHSNVTYTATSATTLTITNCPCTISVSQPAPVTSTYSPTKLTTSKLTTVPAPTGTGGGTKTTIYPTYGNSSTVVTYTPPPTTYISGTIPITSSLSPTKTPVAPTTSHTPIVVPTAAAGKVGPVGALLAAGLAVIAL